MAIWIIRPGKNGEVQDQAQNEGYALIGWAELGDLTNVNTVKEIIDLIKKNYPDKTDRIVTNDSVQIFNFKNDIAINDICVLPFKKSRKVVLGRFIGGYTHFPENNEFGRHGRSVQWVGEISRDEIPRNLRRSFRSYQTVHEIIDRKFIKWLESTVEDFENAESTSVVDMDFSTTRNKVEAAIDKYDNPNQEIIGGPSSYWVVSTLEKRKHKIFATKKIVKAAGIGNYDRRGGWYQYRNACSVLHNAGYIVVDKQGEPITKIKENNGKFVRIPEDRKFLMKGEDRIIAVAKNYYLEPAKERNESSVTIVVKELHDRIGLINQYGVVESALRKLENSNIGIILNVVKSNNMDRIEGVAEPYSVQSIIDDGCFIEKKKLDSILQILEEKKSLILQGPPGTGKTWLAKRLAYALIKYRDDNKIESHQFHPSFSYEEFVKGWRPDPENGKLKKDEGPFLRLIKTAKINKDSIYVMVIEEINRGNPAQIFGEMLTLLEVDKRDEKHALKLAYSDENDTRIYIPQNLFVIGTMNIADRSLAMVDLALRRRFAFVNLEPSLNNVWQKWVHKKNGIALEILEEIKDLIDKLNAEIEHDSRLGSQFRVGHSYVTPPKDKTITDGWDWFERVVEYEIKPLLEEYWFDSPQKVKAEIKKLRKSK